MNERSIPPAPWSPAEGASERVYAGVTPERWRPTLPGWSDDILPFYREQAKRLADLENPTIAEIGVAWGRSALYLAEQLLLRGARGAELWAIDPWDPHWTWPPEATPAAAWRFPREPMLHTLVNHAQPDELDLLHLVRAKSAQARHLFANDSFDLVFLDGDHSAAGILEDLNDWWSAVAPEGVLSGHDYAPEFPEVVAAVDSFARYTTLFEPLKVEGTVWILKRHKL